MRFQGKLTNWNDDKGFGFVEPNGGGTRSFVHIKSFQKRTRRPVEGDLIVYEQVKEPQGKFKAVNISLVTDRKLKTAMPQKAGKFGSLVSVTFCVTLISITVLELLPVEILYLYIGASILAFIAYAYDKSSARNGRWRTPESHLHLLGLIGGWPGAFYAQNKLRHKSNKKEFKQVYWATVVTNICVFVWLLGEQGQQFLETIVG
ncbi:DUF1294 domain-containing protein [Alteromonas aestuariivivens]|uniref:DUF1294 domain-containing protein n=1 Tax=Alteromonas aestuariivivens TaxID=1938339 RepID=A0A3D8M3W2_9ALTE|nr:DUF1294 domain-containing protein [Alteromonas aestuariivivens]